MTEFQLEKVQKLTVDQMGRLKRTSAFEMGRRSAPAALSCFAALGVLAFMSPYASEHPQLIYSAFVLLVITYLTSLALIQRFETIYDANPRFWHILKSIAVIVTAATWGVVSAMAIYFYPDSWISLLAAVITAAMCAGGMYSLGMKLTLLDSFLVAMLLPNIVVGITIGGTSGTVLGFIFFVYLGYCSAQGRNIYREYWQARINTELLSEETKRQLHNLTYQDKLTGLPNRALFLDRLNQAVLEAKRGGHFVGLMILGLDRFKKINDTLGYQSGDEILKVVAHRLRDCVRESDTVTRLGGDIFAVVLPDPGDDRGLARLAQKILNRLVQPVEAKGLELIASTSIGLTIFKPGHISQAEKAEQAGQDIAGKLQGNAEAAMLRAKEKGGNNYQYYEKSMNAKARESLQLETQLRRALERDEFLLHYQPKIDLGSGQITGFEALLRWAPAGKGIIIPPGNFIPMLEDTGLIVPVGEWVIRTACKQNKAWQNAGHGPVRMAVNLSVRQFREQDIAYLVNNILEETGLDAKWLELEITESMLMDQNDKCIRMLTDLSDMGVHLTIDDFGTGYSSLAYLKQLPVGTLKIDRSFVKDITTDPNDAAVVQAVVAMAHNLHLRVVAEGAETAEQAVFLYNQSCDEMQGFFFSRPVSAEMAEPFLEKMYHDQITNLIPGNNDSFKIA